MSADAANVIRQGYAGLLWTKQAYVYDVERWLKERGVQRDSDTNTRNQHWFHMYSADIISMPDKWEYPWFAAWDLAFHSTSLAFVDPEFAAEQLSLMLLERYQHPNGQLPAYEWNFDDVNPPVHAWAALFNYRLNRGSLGDQAIPFLKRTFNSLLANHTWWLNRKDRDGRNLFEGGFLGLDNIGVFDRSSPLPTGGYIEQADGTAWMAFYSQNMLDLALEIALVDSTYEDMAIKFYEHVMAIAAASNRSGAHDSMWDEEDGFFYDVLRVPGQFNTRLKVRSLVGLLPAVRRLGLPPGGRRPASAAVRSGCSGSTRTAPSSWRTSMTPALPGVGGRFMLVAARRQEAAAGSRAHARSQRVPRRPRHPIDLPLSPRAPLRLQFEWTGIPGRLSAGRIGHRDVRRQLELARSDLGAHQRAPDSGPLADVRLLRRRFQGRVPDRIGPVHEPLRGGTGAVQPARQPVPPRSPGAPPDLRRDEEVPGGPATGRTSSCSTSISTETTAPASAPAIRPAGPRSSPP